MHETMIELKLEEEMKPLKDICDKLLSTIKHEFECGVENVDTKEMGEAIDMLKDVYEAKEKIAKACYYKKIVEAMEKSEEEDKEEEKYMLRKFKEEAGGDEEQGRRFYDDWRYMRSGRFAPRGKGSYDPSRSRSRRGYTEMMPMYDMMPDMHDPEYYRDMDRDTHHRMYYSGGSNSSGGNIGGMSGNRSNSGNEGSDGRRNYDEEGRSDGRRNNSGSGRDYREGRSGQRRRGYMETKEIHSDNTPESKQQRMRELDAYTKELAEDVTEMITDASQEEKTMLKSKLQTLIQKI